MDDHARSSSNLVFAFTTNSSDQLTFAAPVQRVLPLAVFHGLQKQVVGIYLQNCKFQLSIYLEYRSMNALIPLERVESRILFIRGEKVIVDSDLAELYGVTTKAFNQAIKRNIHRFPDDFMFQLTADEVDSMRSQIATTSPILWSQIVTSKERRGGRRYMPYVFTEHGALMAANILNSDRAVEASVQVVRAFVKLRQMLSSNADLSRKVEALERKYDANFKVVFNEIKKLMTPPPLPQNKIGFLPTKKKK